MGAPHDEVDPTRHLLLVRALTLSYVSVAWVSNDSTQLSQDQLTLNQAESALTDAEDGL